MQSVKDKRVQIPAKLSDAVLIDKSKKLYAFLFLLGTLKGQIKNMLLLVSMTDELIGRGYEIKTEGVFEISPKNPAKTPEPALTTQRRKL